jgi:hypothetical protein
MAINVVVNTGSASTVQVKPTKTIAAVSVVPTANITLGSLTNVDATDPDEGEVLVYDAANNVFIVKQIEFDSNNITNINGGIF